MIQSASHPVMLLSGGEQQIFNPGELREELVRCFLGAGLEESCYLAGDIVLAVEYTVSVSLQLVQQLVSSFHTVTSV